MEFLARCTWLGKRQHKPSWAQLDEAELTVSMQRFSSVCNLGLIFVYSTSTVSVKNMIDSSDATCLNASHLHKPCLFSMHRTHGSTGTLKYKHLEPHSDTSSQYLS